MKKRMLAALLTAAMLLTLLPSAALAEELSQEQCSCVSLCTEGEINLDCPVCGAEGAALGAVCNPAEPGPAPNPAPEPAQEQGQASVALPVSEVDAANLPDMSGTDDLTVTGGELGTDYDYENHTLTVRTGAALTISGTTATDKIVVGSGVAANLTLIGVNVDVSGVSGANALDVTGATVTLTLVGENFLISGHEKAGVLVPTDSALIIEGGGKLTARGGKAGQDGGAGIGANQGGSCGTISINSGTVDTMAIGGGGAGIGLGGWGGSGGTITIAGGYVLSVGAGGEGSFADKNAANITVSGGVVETPQDTKLSGVSKNNCLIIDKDRCTLYGTDCAITSNLTIPDGKALTVDIDQAITIAENVSLTNNGSLYVNGTVHGSLTNNGLICKSTQGQLPDGTTGAIDIDGSFCGDFVVSGGTRGTDFNYANDTLTVQNSAPLRVTMLPNITDTASGKIMVAGNVTANITLKDVRIALSITKSPQNAFQIEEGASVTITLLGENSLKASSGSDYVGGGHGIECKDTAMLTIGGMGTMLCAGGAAGDLGGWGGAGIKGNVTVTGGNVTAKGGFSGNGNHTGSRTGGAGVDGILTLTGGDLTVVGGKGCRISYLTSPSGEGGVGVKKLIMSGGTAHITGGDSGDGSSMGGLINYPGVGVDQAEITGGLLIARGGMQINRVGAGIKTLGTSQNCLVFNNDAGQTYGAYTLTEDLELRSGQTLAVASGSTLTVEHGVKLTNNGIIDIDGGVVVNNGTIKNYGTINGDVGGGTPVIERSDVTATFQDETGRTIPYAIWGERVNLVATAKKAQSTKNALLQKAAEKDSVDFYLGGVDGTLLGTAEVTDIDGVPTARLEIDGALWETGFHLGENTITADFGGTSGLLENVAQATLTVKGRYSEDAFLTSGTESRYNGIILSDTFSGFRYLCTTSPKAPEKDAEGWEEASFDKVGFWGLAHLTDYYLWCYVPAGHALYAETEVYGPIAVHTPDGPWISYADTSWYENDPDAASYTLTTPAQLAGVAKVDVRGKTLYLGADIDLSGHEWYPMSLENAVFDGRGHAITGMEIAGEDNGAGLFSEVYSSVLQNFTVSGEITGAHMRVGGMASCCLNSSIINVGSDVDISVLSKDYELLAGGIAGNTHNTTIYNSYARGSIAIMDGGASEYTYIGGIIGAAEILSFVQNCYYYGALAGAGNMGGITGYSGGEDAVVSCWSNTRKTGEDSGDGEEITDAAALLDALGDYALLQSICENSGLTAVPWTLTAENGAWPALAAPQGILSQPTAAEPSFRVTAGHAAPAYQWQRLDRLAEPEPDQWALDEEHGAWKSQNAGNNNTAATLTAYIDVPEGGAVSFAWRVSSEKNFDRLIYTLTDSSGSIHETDAISGTEMSEFATVRFEGLTAGTYELTVRYAKDITGSSGSDCGWVKLSGDFYSFDWTNIPDATGGTLTNTEIRGNALTGETVRCAAAYPWGETLTSDSFAAAEMPRITFDSQGGSAVSSIDVFTNGKIAKPTDPTRDGYTFGGWYREETYTTRWNFDTDTVTADMTLYAKWTRNSSGTTTSNRPSAKVDGTGGTVKAGNGTVAITPDEGYQIGKITVNGKEADIPADGKLTGLKRTDKVVVTFEKIPDKPTVDTSKYTDLKAGAWYYEASAFVVEHGLFQGTSNTTFSPNAPMTRAMLTTVLARVDGQDTAAPEGGKWCDAGMKWAVEQGISDGANPDGSITREQLAAMLYRFAGSPAVEGDPLSAFHDGDTVGDYAKSAMGWAVGQGILTGKDGGRLDPDGNATRAEVAAVLQRFIAGNQT